MDVAGGIVALAGLVLAVRSALLLAGRGRPARGPTPAFVIAGPYRRVRNPLFGGVVLALAGLALGTRWPVLALVTVAAAVVLHLWVVRREEPRLRVRFGPAYEAYLANVPRWLPRRDSRGNR
jgi:protein-S-isoprenylcysteine O-methyltransferase Ste14